MSDLTSVIRYVQALDTTATDGSGKTGLAFSDITAKYLTKGGTLTSLTTENITTLGTYQAPSDSAHVRIKELAGSDPTKGIYEVHFHNTQVLAAGVELWLFLSATGARFQPLELRLADLTLVQSSADSISTAVGDLYHADIQLTKDDANSKDEYTVIWMKNGIVQTSGITVPTIEVIKRSDGTDLVASTAMSAIGSTGGLKYDEPTNRITAGEAVLVTVTATINAGTRTFRKVITRDSA